MNRRRIALQIRAILVPYRVEHTRRDSSTMEQFRARSRSLLDELEDAVRPYPDLQAMMADARHELDRDDASARGGLAEEAVDRRGQLVDPEGLR